MHHADRVTVHSPPAWGMWWADTTHNAKMHLLCCSGTVFMSLPGRNGVEESEMGHERMQGAWLLPGPWQGAPTPCAMDVAVMEVFRCGVQLYKHKHSNGWDRGHCKLILGCWAQSLHCSAWKSCRKVAGDPSRDKEQDWQLLVGEGHFSTSLICSICSKVIYICFFSPHNNCSRQGQ